MFSVCTRHLRGLLLSRDCVCSLRRSARSGGKVSYKEDASESDPSDVSEAEDAQEETKAKDDENAQTIEKIIDVRIGMKGGRL